MDLQAIVDSYGYPAILIGTFFEGETILVMGGVASKLGYLQLPWVILCAFTGSLLGDQLMFFLGRHRGDALLTIIPGWKRRAERILPRLEKHKLSLILGFRFFYGMRTVTPFVIGMSRVPVATFLLLNTLSAAAWAAIIGGLGFLFGHGIELVLGDIIHYEKEVFVGVLSLGLVLWVIHHFLEKKR